MPTPIDGGSTDYKVNRHEAGELVRLVQKLRLLYAATDAPLLPSDIGIITPYRAQIAHILDRFTAAGLPTDEITVDTVERYQGGARRIILLSLCTNHASQMESLCRPTAEGVDRKLNVAMTRAREQLIILGNAEVLKEGSVYAELLEYMGG